MPPAQQHRAARALRQPRADVRRDGDQRIGDADLPVEFDDRRAERVFARADGFDQAGRLQVGNAAVGRRQRRAEMARHLGRAQHGPLLAVELQQPQDLERA
ncbi:hypothetical protein [Xenophilus sp. Marseille-Q4582]|uniref:hypothetical protein n=1 Tax=Xenophilus sp. Marseille-Q4582 TaxID=2866600 RepID=UPI0021029B6B|nr:hypothetical protein [Xenophilus sp. Marseille-Q4582]